MKNFSPVTLKTEVCFFSSHTSADILTRKCSARHPENCKFAKRNRNQKLAYWIPIYYSLTRCTQKVSSDIISLAYHTERDKESSGGFLRDLPDNRVQTVQLKQTTSASIN